MTTTTTARGGEDGGKHLRWTRIVKTVEVKEVNAGLLRGSIAGKRPPPSDGSSGQTASSPSSDEGHGRGPNGGGKKTWTKTILAGVYGSASPGEVLAVMGPSGSGKTSVLDVLSGRSSYDSGTILLDGEVVTDRVMKKMKKRVAYVKQSDLFFGHLTVRDQLTYTALLRLPSAWPRARKDDEVDRVIKRLRLGKCADTAISAVSGGERKRVNIGSELLTDPAIVLLDEPTSGLDSTGAVALVRALHALAREEGKTVVTSIHQPSSAVFFGFDKLMLLADGKVVYFGTPAGSLEHVEKLGLGCPAGYNAADHHMDLLVGDGPGDDDDDGGDDDEDGGDSDSDGGRGDGSGWDGTPNDETAPRDAGPRRRRGATGRPTGGETAKRRLVDSWDDEASARRIEDAGERARSDHHGQQQKSIVETERSFNTSWWTQYTVLVHRSMKNSRSAIFTPLNLVKAGAIGFVCGLLWFQMPYTESTVFDRSSYYFFTMTFWVSAVF